MGLAKLCFTGSHWSSGARSVMSGIGATGRMALCAWTAASLGACAGQDADPTRGQRSSAERAIETDIARPSDRVIGERQSEPQSMTPSPRAVKQPSIATDRVVLTLDSVPSFLEDEPLAGSAWSEWLQASLGPSVEVRSARLLRKPGSDSPSRGRGAQDRAAPGSTLVIQVAPASSQKIREAVERASAREGIAVVETDPVWSFHAPPNDPLYPQQQHLPIIHAAEAWDTVTGSPNVVVAVLDSGLDVTHPDLSGALWDNPGEVSDGIDNDGNGLVDDLHGWNFVGNNNNLADSSGHGTHVAGLVGATGNNGVGVAGVAFGVELMPLAIGGASIQATDVAEAIVYAVDEGADIINMSFGGPETFTGAREAIDYAVANGVLLFASAGNNSSEGYNYPAVYQDVIAVAATDDGDARAGLSNYGRWVDIAAPGLGITSTLPNGEYGLASGTSQSTPIVAGVAALIKSAHPAWSPEQVRAQLLAAADDISSLNPDYVGLLGAGRVNAQAAVGPAITAARPYLAGVHVLELAGNGDQDVGAGETASIDVGLHFTSGGAPATAELVSNSPFISVGSGPVSFGTQPDRTSVARFTLSVASNAPSDTIASLSVRVESPPGTLVAERPIGFPIAASFLQLELPWAYDRTLLPLPSGGHVLVADEFQPPPLSDIVYVSFRDAGGSFSVPAVLSDTTRNARRPRAVVAPNGDVHVVYSQFVATLDFAGFPAYARYDAALGQWEPSVVFTNGAGLTRFGERNTTIALDAAGAVHIAFATIDSVVVQRQVGGVWSEQVAFPIGDSVDTREVELVNTAQGLLLFVRPVLRDVFGPSTFDRPMLLLEFDGSEWSAPVEITQVAPNELAHLPFPFAGEAQRFYQPAGSSLVNLAELAGTAWAQVTSVADIGSVDFIRGFFGVRLGSASFAAALARPVAATLGSEREVLVDGVTSALFGDRKLRAVLPFLRRDAGELYVFNQENELFRVPGFGTFVEQAAFTSYYTTAPLASSALPSVPVVLDAGVTTGDSQQLFASWSSSHASGIASYRVAWGTLPGGDDLLPWQTTTATSGVFDLVDQRLLPGQTAYASVQARSNALLSSDMGVSDGITFVAETPCTAPPWNATVVYHDVGMLVTHAGATWSNLYWQSNQVPGGGASAWAFVEECTGEPVLPPCTAPAWSPTAQYNPGNRVSHDGFEFENLWPSSVPPDGTSGNPWKWVATCEP